MEFTLQIWRQPSPGATGELKSYKVTGITPNHSFLEMLDTLNIQLLSQGEEAISFASDCLEGICGTCSMVINGVAHGPKKAVTTCQLYMRNFTDGDTITIEPFRAAAFPLVKDLVVDRSAFDRIIQKGGYISVNTGNARDANSLPIGKKEADEAMDAAQCIGCGACVASCKNSSAMLFVSAKVAHLGRLPQGQPERERRVARMVEQMEEEGFGSCTNQYECSAVCPKEIPVRFIAELNHEYLRAKMKGF